MAAKKTLKGNNIHLVTNCHLIERTNCFAFRHRILRQIQEKGAMMKNEDDAFEFLENPFCKNNKLRWPIWFQEFLIIFSQFSATLFIQTTGGKGFLHDLACKSKFASEKGGYINILHFYQFTGISKK